MRPMEHSQYVNETRTIVSGKNEPIKSLTNHNHMQLYEHYHILAKKIIEKHIKLARQNKITENFGEKDYREYREKINSEDNLSTAQKANLCSFLSDELNNIDINS